MKIFDFLVKLAVFRASLLFLGDSRHALWPQSNMWSRKKCMTGISQKKERCPKKGYFDEKIKKFYKSKIDGLQKLSTRAPRFYDFLHLKGWPFINHKISQQIFGKLRFLNLRSLLYIIIVQKINISTIDNFFIFFLVFQTLCLWKMK